MGAVTDPRASMVFEWVTGTTDSQTVHAVVLEIPPENISIKRSKRVQESLTTKGYVFNHGPEKLPVISCRGKAYQPSNAIDEGFNQTLGLSGLELLNAAYVSSGRVSSSKSLVNSLAPVFVSNVAAEPTTLTRSEAITQRVSNRSSLFDAAYASIQNYSTLSDNSEIKVDSTLLPSDALVQSNVDSIKTMSLAHLWSIQSQVLDSDFATVRGLLENLTVVSTNSTLIKLQQMSTTNTAISQLTSQFEYFLYKFKNDHQGFSIPGLDPIGIWQIKNDPFTYLRSISVGRLATLLSGVTTTQALNSFLVKNDQIIAITLYWNQLVFVGHFDSFNITQDANIIGLWSWDFNFIAHESWILKGTNILSLTKTFDQTATSSEVYSTIFTKPNRIDALDNLLQLSATSSQTTQGTTI